MSPEIVAAVRTLWPELEKLGVEHLDVFGSEARGEATLSSDVDILVHLRTPTVRTLPMSTTCRCWWRWARTLRARRCG